MYVFPTITFEPVDPIFKICGSNNIIFKLESVGVVILDIGLLSVVRLTDQLIELLRLFSFISSITSVDCTNETFYTHRFNETI